MTFSPLQTQILTGAAGDLAQWTAATPTPWDEITKVWEPRALGMRLRNDFIDAAIKRRQVPLNAERWLGRPLTPADAASFSRALRTLEAKGLIVRVSDSRDRGAARHTRNIRFTEAGERIAAELLAKSPAIVGSQETAEPAMATPQPCIGVSA